jgi:hypothetical protein
VFLNRQTGLIESVRDVRAHVWPIRRLLKTVIKAGGVREQMANRDLRRFARGQRRLKFWQPLRHGRVERQRAALDQRHRRGGDDRLGHRRETKQCVDGHGRAGLAVGQAGRLLEDGLAIVSDKHDRADDAPLIQRARDRAAHFDGKACGSGHGLSA